MPQNIYPLVFIQIPVHKHCKNCSQRSCVTYFARKLNNIATYDITTDPTMSYCITLLCWVRFKVLQIFLKI